MKKIIVWTALASILMLGCPLLAVTYAGDAGMAICFLLFFAINPLFCVVCGAFAGREIKRLWTLPFMSAALFLAGVWLFFEMAEPAFLLYFVCYLIIGVAAMFISRLLNKGKR